MNASQAVCFVVMGFGTRTDYESGRTLNLDATYAAIIKPAVEACGLRPVRADDILHSGVIDGPMYDMLLRADLVIADITTGNANALYELGVRHALRPNSTIIMSESEGRLHFDLNHVNTFKYEHLGKDIGFSEATRATASLKALITEVLKASSPDSPVYTFLPRLRAPTLTDAEFAELVDDTQAANEELADLIRAGEQALQAGHFKRAIEKFQACEQLKPQDAYIKQRLALATYKSKSPSVIESLIRGLMIIEILDPAKSNDPETLGLAGAMKKRLWIATHDPVQLDSAIDFYGRGFSVRQDYYNGENLASCLEMRAMDAADAVDSRYDMMTAKKTRARIVESLRDLVDLPSFDQRSDKKWIYATLAGCLRSLNDDAGSLIYENLFLAQSPFAWECETYAEGQKWVMKVREFTSAAGYRSEPGEGLGGI